MHTGTCNRTWSTLDLEATRTLMTILHWGLFTQVVRESNLAILFFQYSSSARGPTSSASLRICSDCVRIYHRVGNGEEREEQEETRWYLLYLLAPHLCAGLSSLHQLRVAGCYKDL